MPFNLEAWSTEFHPRLGHTRRWQGFEFLARELSQKTDPIHIVETGCVRTPDNWDGDGQTTRIWDWMVKDGNGFCVSVDINPEHVKVAKRLTKTVNVVCMDSILFLAQAPAMEKVDLLFLDSYDHNPPYPLSELHHAGELAACWERLKSGCLIAVDDCNTEDSGKQVMVEFFMTRMGIPKALNTYIRAWRKP